MFSPCYGIINGFIYNPKMRKSALDSACMTITGSGLNNHTEKISFHILSFFIKKDSHGYG